MRTTSLMKVTRQIALPIPLNPTSLSVRTCEDATTRAAVIIVLARLLLEAAASAPLEEASDEP